MSWFDFSLFLCLPWFGSVFVYFVKMANTKCESEQENTIQQRDNDNGDDDDDDGTVYKNIKTINISW